MSTPLSWVALNEFGGARVRVPVLALLLAFGCGEMGSEAREGSTSTNALPNTPAPVSTSPTNTTAMPTSRPGTTAITTTPPSSADIILPDITVVVPPPTPVPLNACTNVTGDVDTPMSRFVVRHTDAPPRVLYSWTTKEQIEELRTNPTLLTRSVSSDGEVGRAQGLIAGGTDPVSLLLNEERFANKRYAWTNPWATRLGWTGDDYGDRLLAITLRADAWVGQMMMDDSVGLSWTFRDMEGNSVTQDEVLANPERLAAVYFYDQRDMPECRFESRTQGQLYREYFILNEGMLESWSAFTEEVKAELDSDLAALRRLLDTLTTGECESVASCWRDGVMEAWSSGPADGIVQSYIGGLAFPNDLYAPTRTNLARLIERLEAVPLDDEPLQHDVASRDNDAGIVALPPGDAAATDVAPALLGVDGGNLDMSGNEHDAGVAPR